MSEQPKSDRTSVTISKSLQRKFKMACVYIGITQRTVLEAIIREWLQEHEVWTEHTEREEE